MSVRVYALPSIAQALLGIGAAMARSGREKEVADILGVVRGHAATPSWYRERAALIFSEAAATVPPQTVATAEAKGSAADLLVVAEEVLEVER